MDEMVKQFQTDNYFCFAKSHVSDYEWYLSQECPLIKIPGIEYMLVRKDDKNLLKDIGYEYISQVESKLYKELGMEFPEIKSII